MSHPFLSRSGVAVSSPLVQSLLKPGDRITAEWRTHHPDVDAVQVLHYAHDSSGYSGEPVTLDVSGSAATLAEASVACHDALQDFFEHTLDEEFGLTAEAYVPALSRALQTVRTRTATPATEAWGLTDPRWHDTGQLALKLVGDRTDGPVVVDPDTN